MQDRNLDFSEVFYSMKRTELLLEELIFQQCLSRAGNADDANTAFTKALQNVNQSFREWTESLPPSK